MINFLCLCLRTIHWVSHTQATDTTVTVSAAAEEVELLQMGKAAGHDNKCCFIWMGVDDLTWDDGLADLCRDSTISLSVSLETLNSFAIPCNNSPKSFCCKSYVSVWTRVDDDGDDESFPWPWRGIKSSRVSWVAISVDGSFNRLGFRRDLLEDSPESLELPNKTKSREKKLGDCIPWPLLLLLVVQVKW